MGPVESRVGTAHHDMPLLVGEMKLSTMPHAARLNWAGAIAGAAVFFAMPLVAEEPASSTGGDAASLTVDEAE